MIKEKIEIEILRNSYFSHSISLLNLSDVGVK